MIVWRLTRYPTLDGAGGVFAHGRWHTKGRRVIYTATSPAGALVEVLAGLDLDPGEIPVGYRMLTIGIGDGVAVDVADDLQEDWRTNETVTRAFGDAWLDRGHAPLLRVPSAIIADTENVLIAPARIDPTRIEILSDTPFVFDERLLPAR